MKFAPELLAKAKETKSAEELLTLAKENDIELTTEEAEKYFGTLHPANGELSDDELDNVSGGDCGYSDEDLSFFYAYNVGDRVACCVDKDSGGWWDPNGRIVEGTIEERKIQVQDFVIAVYLVRCSMDCQESSWWCEQERIIRRV